MSYVNKIFTRAPGTQEALSTSLVIAALLHRLSDVRIILTVVLQFKTQQKLLRGEMSKLACLFLGQKEVN